MLAWAIASESRELIVVGLTIGSLYALVAVGYTLIYGVLRFINFAHGEVYAVGAYCAFIAGSQLSQSLWLIVVAGALGGAIVGGVSYRFVYRPLSDLPNLLLLATSIGLSVVLRNSLSLGFGVQFTGLDIESTPVRLWGSLTVPSGYVNVLIATLLMSAVLWYLVERSPWGIELRAVAADRKAAEVRGVDTVRVTSLAFVVAGAYAGVAGALANQITKLSPDMGVATGLKAFTAAVLGGIGSVQGSVLAGFVLGVFEALVAGYIGSEYRDALVFSILLVALLVRPHGLLGRSPGRDT